MVFLAGVPFKVQICIMNEVEQQLPYLLVYLLATGNNKTIFHAVPKTILCLYDLNCITLTTVLLFTFPYYILFIFIPCPP